LKKAYSAHAEAEDSQGYYKKPKSIQKYSNSLQAFYHSDSQNSEPSGAAPSLTFTGGRTLIGQVIAK
tara:strand:+ start:695 stop:895 length:201 start_codon:yes stop_codon:yes gene_type:complete